MVKKCSTCEYFMSYPDVAKCHCLTSPKYEPLGLGFSNADVKPCDYYKPNDYTIKEVIKKHWYTFCSLLGEDIIEGDNVRINEIKQIEGLLDEFIYKSINGNRDTELYAKKIVDIIKERGL
jgi:hypothetical protein